MTLTTRQITVMNLFIEGKTKAEAMRRAGYSDTTANDHPERVFNNPKFKRELEKRQAKMFKKTDITVEYILEHLKNIVDDTETSPANRMRALEALMKHLGMMTDKVDIRIKEDIVDKLQAGRDRVALKVVGDED